MGDPLDDPYIRAIAVDHVSEMAADILDYFSEEINGNFSDLTNVALIAAAMVTVATAIDAKHEEYPKAGALACMGAAIANAIFDIKKGRYKT